MTSVMNVFILEMVIMQCPLLFVNKLFVLQMLAAFSCPVQGSPPHGSMYPVQGAP